MSSSRTDYEKIYKKLKRQRYFSLLMGFLFGVILIGNLFYWYPFFEDKFSLPNIPQVTLRTEETKTTTSSSEFNSEENSTENTELVSDNVQFSPRLNFDDYQTISTIYQPLSEKLDTIIEQHQISGTFLTIKNNQMVLFKSYGDAAKQESNPFESSYMIASLQKSLTATLLLQLVEEKKIKLDDKLNQFLPEIPNSENITLNQMLAMTSGLYLTDKKPKNTQSYQELLNFVHTHTEYRALNKWAYADVNYVLLAEIIEKISNQTYDDLLYKKIIEPLNLDHSFLFDRQKEQQILISSYKHKNPLQNEVKIGRSAFINEFAVGNWAFSASDYLIYIQALLDGKLMNQESLNLLWSYPPANYDYTYKSGFYHSQENRMRGHGLFNGYEPTIWLSPSADTAVLFFSNTYQDDKLNMELTKQIFDITTQEPLGGY